MNTDKFNTADMISFKHPKKFWCKPEYVKLWDWHFLAYPNLGK